MTGLLQSQRTLRIAGAILVAAGLTLLAYVLSGAWGTYEIVRLFGGNTQVEITLDAVLVVIGTLLLSTAGVALIWLGRGQQHSGN